MSLPNEFHPLRSPGRSKRPLTAARAHAAYYNEIDRYCAGWLRNLIVSGLIAPGDVDERDIREVSSNDLRKYTQCHFFAGIGGWSLALRLAPWNDNRAVWTGSCPCQPFSTAGKRKGKADERHLWPAWFRLIRECRPAVVFGEQVAAAIAGEWLDEAAHDLEAEGYAVAASVLPACSVAKPHRRDRIYFVADAGRNPGMRNRHGNAGRALGDADEQRLQGWQILAKRSGERLTGPAGLEWIAGADGKWRPVKSGIRLLADGVPGRVGKLRAYGNAIIPQLAAEFIRAAQAERKS